MPLRFLITAGPTREHIDPVRFLSNDSSGRMGFALAEQARRRGHRVTLVHGPVGLAAPKGVRAVAVVSADDMLAACRAAWRRCDVLVMAAAVADYRPAKRSRGKIKKSTEPYALTLRPTPDVLATLAAQRRSANQIIMGFALEDRAPRKNAAGKLERKRLDAIVLNRPRAIGAERSDVEVLVRGGRWQKLGAANKPRHALRLIELCETLHFNASNAGDVSL